MSVHTKMLPINETIKLSFVGPFQNKEKILQSAETFGFVEISDSVSWETIYPQSSPGTALAGARYREGLTQRQLAELTGIPLKQISEMENNKRPIKEEYAKILGKELNIGYKVFLP